MRKLPRHNHFRSERLILMIFLMDVLPQEPVVRKYCVISWLAKAGVTEAGALVQRAVAV